MPEMNHQDRRRNPRVDKVTLVHVSSVEEQGFQVDLATGRTLNMSMGGIRLELRQNYPLPLRSILGLSLALDSEILEVDGLVIYLQVLDRDRCAVGIQFKDLSDEAREKIKKYLQSGPSVNPMGNRPAGTQRSPSARS